MPLTAYGFGPVVSPAVISPLPEEVVPGVVEVVGDTEPAVLPGEVPLTVVSVEVPPGPPLDEEPEVPPGPLLDEEPEVPPGPLLDEELSLYELPVETPPVLHTPLDPN